MDWVPVFASCRIRALSSGLLVGGSTSVSRFACVGAFSGRQKLFAMCCCISAAMADNSSWAVFIIIVFKSLLHFLIISLASSRRLMNSGLFSNLWETVREKLRRAERGRASSSSMRR